MRRLLLLFLLLLGSWLTLGTVQAQISTIAQESFESASAPANTATSFGYGSFTSNTFDLRATSATEYFLRSQQPVTGFYSGTTGPSIANINGSWLWAGEGVRGTGTTSNSSPRPAGYVQLNTINISGKSNIQVKVLFADSRGLGSGATAGGGTSQWDNADFVRVKVRMDNATTWTTIAQFTGDNPTPGLGGRLRQDTNLNGTSYDAADASSPALTNAFQDFTFNASGTGTTLDVMIEADYAGASEELAFDNIRVVATQATTAAPVLANIEGTNLNYNEGDAPTQITGSLIVSDTDSPNLTGGSVRITTGFVSAQDRLNFTNQNGITGVYDASTGVLTLTGTASVATYQAALRSVRYQNSQTVTAIGGLRLVSFSLTDGTTASNTAQRSVIVNVLLNGPAALPYLEDFETDGEGLRYASDTWVNSGSCLGFLRTNLNPYTCTPVTIGNVSGSYYWYSEGTSNPANPNPTDIGTMTLAPVNASNYRSLRFNIRMATGQSAQWENDDFVKFYYRVNGGSWVLFSAFYGNGTLAASGALQRDTDLDGVADGGTGSLTLNSTMQNVDLALPPAVTGASVDFQILISSNGQEEFMFDRINITGTQLVAPTVTTGSTGNIATTTAAINNNSLTSDGGASLSDYGVVYVAGTGTPTTSNSKLQAGTSSPGSFPATFSVNLSSLTAGAQYTARAYATNSIGTSYGANVTFTTTPNAPVVTTPANGGVTNTNTPNYAGTAQSGATVTVYVDGSALSGTVTANGSGWTLGQPTALAQGSHTVYATAVLNGSAASANSNTNTFTVDTVRPGVAISSTAVASGGTTTTSPVPFTVTFSESVTGFLASDVTVGNGMVSGFSGSGTTYTFNVTPTTAGVATTVNIAANAAQDAAGNSNTAASQFNITYQQPTVTVASVTRLTPSPTATPTVSYRVAFSGSVTGLTISNFNLTTSGLSGAAVSSVSGSGATYTVTVNTGSGDGTLRLNVANATGVTPTISNVPYTSGEPYTITKSFAAAPTLRIQSGGSASNNGDVTAFVDVVQVLQSGTGGTDVANAVQNASFETNNVDPNGFKKTADGVVASPWLFTGLAGVSRNNSAFGSSAADGDAVGVVQSQGDNNASISQSLAVPTGSYQVRFQAIQRNYTAKDQRLNVFVNDVFVGNIQPNDGTPPTYDTFTSATFTVTAPALTATVSTTSASPTSTAPIPFAVSFSQSVGSSFTASDVTVSGGTVASGSFSGSGSGPYTFTVIPSGIGPVTVSLAANVALDANNTGNSASNSVSVQFQAPTITLAPASLPNGTQGVAYSQTLTASGGTAPYTYVITARALPSGLTLTPAGVLSGTPAASGSFTFTVTVTDNSAAPGPYSGSRSYTLTIAAPAVTAVTWTGTVSTDWFNANNWMPNQVPDATIDVTIPTSPSGGRFPAITPGAASTRNLTINSGATLTQISGTLAIAANLTNNGTFQPTGGTVVLGTTALSNIVGSSAVRFWNLTVGTSGAQLSTSIGSSVQRLLALNGNFATNGNSFTLESNASSTAMVVNNGSVVNGNVTVQRYIDPSNPGLGYRHYSSPVGNTTIADLATSSFTPVINDSYNPATAPRQVQPYPTVYYYDQSRLATSNASYAVGDFDNGFLSPNALASPLVPGRGYSVNVSGTTLVDLVGQLNNGTITTSTLARGAQASAGWQFLGNPYPSPIDWNQLYATSIGIESGFYVFKSSGQYTGSYATYLTNGQSVNGGISTIPSMQGFFVRAQVGGGRVSFTNQCRLTTYANPAFARQAADTRPTVRLELLTAQGQKDEALVYFEPGATSGIDARYDAVKLGNITRLNLCSRVGSDVLAINGLPNLSASPLTVPLSVQVPSTGRYTLLASQLANVAGNRVVLHDRQTGTLTDLTDPAGYVVELTEGQHGDRFDLLFNPATELTPRKKGQSIPAKRH
jgi:hypothetical protein